LLSLSIDAKLSVMDKAKLSEVAKKLVSPGKGILAADESMGTIQKRFDSIGVESTEENRHSYRQMLFTTPGIEELLSGVILFDETVWQKTEEGTSFPQVLSQRGIFPGIKVDEGKDPAPGLEQEFVTKGLEALPDRLPKYKEAGCVFTKWRVVSVIGDNLPTEGVTLENARRLAEFANLSQEHDFVPIVEPEVLMDGNHTIERCEEVTIEVLTTVFSELEKKEIYLSGMLLKPNFVVQGKDLGDAEASLVAQKTLRVMTKCVPSEVPGIVFLSGGLSPETATLYLNELNKNKNHPWELSFSFGRALQGPVLKAWIGKSENIKSAQDAFYKRAKLNSLARSASYTPEMETT
jgi:fructose-bisphosphate aldolase class I